MPVTSIEYPRWSLAGQWGGFSVAEISLTGPSKPDRRSRTSFRSFRALDFFPPLGSEENKRPAFFGMQRFRTDPRRPAGGRAADTSGRNAEADAARQILQATGVRGGLIVHLGCGDGKLTAALRARFRRQRTRSRKQPAQATTSQDLEPNISCNHSFFMGPMYFFAITTLSMNRCWSYGDGFVPPW